jgi:guanylate kinase
VKFSTERLNRQIAQLTNPEYGIVTPTTEPDVFELNHSAPDPSDEEKLLVITGPSRAGKDSIIDRMVENGHYSHVKTATTRPRRETEGADAYTWMRERLPHETLQEYAVALEREYDLVEMDIHHDDVYGLPSANLSEAGQDRTALLNTDTRGIRTLRRKLVGKYALTSVLISPDSAEELERRMGALSHKSLARLAMAQAYLEEAPGCVDYVFLNRTSDDVARSVTDAAGQIHRIIQRRNNPLLNGVDL